MKRFVPATKAALAVTFAFAAAAAYAAPANAAPANAAPANAAPANAAPANAAPANAAKPVVPPAPGSMADHSAMAGMPGMDMSAPAAETSTQTERPNLAAGLERSRQRAQFFIANLKGSEEVPRGAGDLNGGGTGVIRVQGNRVTFAFTWHGINAPTMGHIHEEVRGKNGPIAQALFTTPMPDTVDAASGVVGFDNAKTADDIRKNPAGFYLNLHTKDHPNGAIRGQLRKLNRPIDVVGAVLHGGPLKAFLSGREEVPFGAGDFDAKAVAFADPHGTRVDYSFAWINLHPTMGHIHKERRGKNGPIAVALFTTPVPDTIVAVSGSVQHVDPATVDDIKHNPKAFYANLHSEQHPNGAARGQLFRR